MNREEIKKTTKSFLKTYNYIAKPVENNSILFSRPTGLGVSDDLLIYFHEIGEEGIIESNLKKVADKYNKIPGGNGGRRFFLSPFPLGRVPEAITTNDFKYQVPVWFFDREFSTEKRLTPLKKLEEDAAKYENERISQPCRIKTGEKKDLLSCLIDELDNPKDSCLRLIVAPAGYGKTVLMGTLYSKLRAKFMENKNKQEFGVRPLLILPGHIKGAASLDGIIDNFIGDEYDYGVFNKKGLKFSLNNGFSHLLMDGLEELILKIPEEFIYTILEEYIYTPGITSQIIISIRKPLLATSPELKEVIDEWEREGAIKVYELCDWDKAQQNAYFKKNIKLKKDEKDNFIKDLSISKPLQKICEVPYYCNLVAELRNENQMGIVDDDCGLVEYAFEKLCEREFYKGIDKDIVPISLQKELFVEIAGESFKGNSISVEMMTEYAEFLLGEIAQETRSDQIKCLLRHAALTSIDNNISFMHDILEQHLTGVFLQDRLKRHTIKIFDKRKIELDSLTGKYLIKNSHVFPWGKILLDGSALSSLPDNLACGFRNILGIFLASDIQGKEMYIKHYLCNRNLEGLAFVKLNLQGFSFKNSRLADVQFIECNLSGVNFDACDFKNTYLDPKCIMKGATMRGAVLELIQIKNKTIDNQKEISKYFRDKTQISLEYEEPCQAVINLRKILGKMAKKGRGIKVPKKFIIRTKCGGGIPSNVCLNVCVKNGLISDAGEWIRIKINLHEDIERFVKQLNTTQKIYEVLDEICKDTTSGCKHIYK